MGNGVGYPMNNGYGVATGNGFVNNQYAEFTFNDPPMDPYPTRLPSDEMDLLDNNVYNPQIIDFMMSESNWGLAGVGYGSNLSMGQGTSGGMGLLGNEGTVLFEGHGGQSGFGHIPQVPDLSQNDMGPTAAVTEQRPGVETSTTTEKPSRVVEVAETEKAGDTKSTAAEPGRDHEERSGAGRTRKAASTKEVVPLIEKISPDNSPQWFKNAHIYLEDGINDETWKKCVANWVLFENEVGMSEASAVCIVKK